MKPEKLSATVTAPFRVNPIEVAIFAAIFGIVGHSVYTLFNERAELFKSALLGGRSSAQESGSPSQAARMGGRSPASTETRDTPLLATLEISCEPQQKLVTPAPRVRLSGAVCGNETHAQTKIINTSNKSEATVFADFKRRVFTTDYIPLVEGRNVIAVSFQHTSGVTASELEIIRGTASSVDAVAQPTSAE